MFRRPTIKQTMVANLDEHQRELLQAEQHLAFYRSKVPYHEERIAALKEKIKQIDDEGSGFIKSPTLTP